MNILYGAGQAELIAEDDKTLQMVDVRHLYRGHTCHYYVYKDNANDPPLNKARTSIT
jgi:hypothetical protein